MTVLSRRLKKAPARLTGKGERWDVWGGEQADFESLDLMMEGIEEEKLLWFVRETEMDDLGVAGILEPENLEWQKERCEVLTKRTL